MSWANTSLAGQAFVPPQYMRFWEFRTQVVKHLFENEERTLKLIGVYEHAEALATGGHALFRVFCIQSIKALQAKKFDLEKLLFPRPEDANSIEQQPFLRRERPSNYEPKCVVEAKGLIEGLRARWEDQYFQFVAGALYDGRLQAFVDKGDNEGPQPITNANWWLHPNMRQGLTTKGNVSQVKKGSMPPLFLREEVRKLCPASLNEAEGPNEGKLDFAIWWLTQNYPAGQPTGKLIKVLRYQCGDAYGKEISETTFRKAHEQVWGINQVDEKDC